MAFFPANTFEQILGGDEEVGKLAGPQVFLKISEKLLEAVVELAAFPLTVLHSGSTGMKQCCLCMVRAQLVRILRVRLLQPLQKAFQKFQTLLSAAFLSSLAAGLTVAVVFQDVLLHM